MDINLKKAIFDHFPIAIDIALIPKKTNPLKISDYRPISLTISIHKMLTKVLVERLKMVLPSTISPNQTTLMRRFLLLTRLWTIGGLASRKVLLLSSTLKKAFDKINWEFLLSILRLKCFPDKMD